MCNLLINDNFDYFLLFLMFWFLLNHNMVSGLFVKHILDHIFLLCTIPRLSSWQSWPLLQARLALLQLVLGIRLLCYLRSTCLLFDLIETTIFSGGAQVMATVAAHGFDEILFGTSTAPVEILPSANSLEYTTIDLQYMCWVRRNQFLFS